MYMSNMKTRAIIVFAVFSASSFLAGALAQEAGALKLVCTAEKEVTKVDQDGKPVVTYSDVSVALPGEVIRYTLKYEYSGADPAEAIVITNPVPENTVYVDKSAAGKDTAITFSIDGGKTYATSDALKIKAADGSERAALPEEYTNLQWRLLKKLAKGDSGTVSFKVKIK